MTSQPLFEEFSDRARVHLADRAAFFIMSLENQERALEAHPVFFQKALVLVEIEVKGDTARERLVVNQAGEGWFLGPAGRSPIGMHGD